MPEPIIIPLIYQEDTSGLARAAAEVQKVQEASEQMNVAQQKAFKETTDAVSGYGTKLQNAAADLADLNTTTKGANKDNKILSDTLKDSARNLNIFGFNVGDVVDKFRAKQTALKGVISGLRATSGAVNVLKAALISSGIGAIVVILGSLVAVLLKSEKGVEFLERAFAAVGATIDVIIDRAVALGNAILKLFSGDFSGAVEDTKKALTGIGDEIAREAEAAYELARAVQQLEDVNRNLRVEFAKQRAEVERLRELAADDSKGFKARAKAAQDAIKIETALEEQRLAAAEENLRIIREQNKLREGNITDDLLDKEADALVEVEDIRAESARRRRRDQNFFESLQRQQLALLRQQAEEERKLEQERLKIARDREEAFEKLRRSLAAQIIQEEQAAATEQERLEFQRDNALASLQQAEDELVARAKFLKQEEEIEQIRQDFARLRALTNERFEKEITKVVSEENKKRLEAEQKRQDEISETQHRLIQEQNQATDALAKIEIQRLDLLRKSGDEELSLEQFKERRKLEIQLEALQKKRENLRRGGASIFSIEVQQLDADIAQIEGGLERFKNLPLFERVKERFKNLFNLSDEDLKEIGGQLSGIVSDVFSGLDAIFQAQISQQDAIIAKRQEAVDALQSQLDEELELKEKGLANDSSLLQQQLAAETELLKKEEEKRLELEKKAARLRLRQQALEIASNIALSVAKAIQANAQFGLVGIITAAAQVASIFALIAKAKAQAAQFSKPQELREGARLEGPTHEHGGIPLLVDDGNGGRRMYEAEKDEWLIGTQPSREHDAFLQRLNNGDFRGYDLNDMANAFLNHKPMPAFTLPELPDYLGGMMPRIREAQAVHETAKYTDRRDMAMKFDELKTEVRSLKKELRKKTHYVPITPEGYMKIDESDGYKGVNLYKPPKRKP